MLRRAPTSITLTTKDIELFKQLIKEKEEKPLPPNINIIQEEEEEEEEVDDIFGGRALKKPGKRTLINARLGIEEEMSFKRTSLFQ